MKSEVKKQNEMKILIESIEQMSTILNFKKQILFIPSNYHYFYSSLFHEKISQVFVDQLFFFSRTHRI